jgi:hypothetical protein
MIYTLASFVFQFRLKFVLSLEGRSASASRVSPHWTIVRALWVWPKPCATVYNPVPLFFLVKEPALKDDAAYAVCKQRSREKSARNAFFRI